MTVISSDTLGFSDGLSEFTLKYLIFPWLKFHHIENMLWVLWFLKGNILYEEQELVYQYWFELPSSALALVSIQMKALP